MMFQSVLLVTLKLEWVKYYPCRVGMMNFSVYLQVLFSVAGISIAQFLLKLAAINLNNPNVLGVWLLGYRINIYLVVAVSILAASTLLWVWVLKSVPLSVAYPFMALAFVIVPLLGFFFLGETFTWRFLCGGALIVSGVVLVST